jgi:hypothetical protein
MPDSDTTGSDTTGSDPTGSDPTGSDPTQTHPTIAPSTGKGKGSRKRGGPQPLTVFTGSHGLQADKPGAGKDADQPGDDTSTATSDPDSKPDLRR